MVVLVTCKFDDDTINKNQYLIQLEQGPGGARIPSAGAICNV